MADVFTRETLLDTLVNVVPIGIMLFFVVLFTVSDPWGGSTLGRALQYALVLVPLVLTGYLTYVAARRIEGA